MGGNKGLTTAMGLTIMVTGFALSFSGFREIGAGTADLWSYLKAAIGSALGIAGSLIVFGTGPLGWAVGLSLSLAVAIAGITVGMQDKLSKVVADGFYKANAGDTSITQIANGFKWKMNLIVEANAPILEGFDKFDETKAKIDNTLGSIDNIGSTIINAHGKANEYIPQLVSLLNQIDTDTKDHLKGTFTTILCYILAAG